MAEKQSPKKQEQKKQNQNKQTKQQAQAKTAAKKQTPQKQEKKSVDHNTAGKKIFQAFDKYEEQTLKHRRFKHNDIVPLLYRANRKNGFHLKSLGESVQGRNIYQLKTGNGETKVLLWSQMHGNESTATMTIFDIINFLTAEDDLNPIRKKILENTTLYFVPMLNPDGAEVFKRRNALDVDLNRDAIRLISPEARILKTLRDNLQPQFGLNLHDQDPHFRVENTKQPASMSFLAPAYESNGYTNRIRSDAKKLVVQLNDVVQQFIPGKTSMYSDTFNPRCFGDAFQKAGTSTILIESGGFPGDTEKQYLRRLNFVAVLSALHSISENSYEEADIKKYKKIPFNKRDFMDLILRNVNIKFGKKAYIMDIGITREEKTIIDGENYHFYYQSKIEDMGDLSGHGAYTDIDANGLEAIQGKVFPETYQGIKNLSDIEENTLFELYDMGYTSVQMQRLPYGRDFSRIPLHLVAKNETVDNEIKVDNNPNFLLQKYGKTYYAIINGFLYSGREKI